MQSFKDTGGQDWSFTITYGTVKRIKAAFQLDLLENAGNAVFQKIAGDPYFFIDLLFFLCKEDADKRGITDEQFAEVLDGDVLDGASKAFMDEYIAFSQPSLRPTLEQIRTKMAQIRDLTSQRALEMVNQVDIEKAATELMEKAEAEAKNPIPTETSTDLPVLPAA